MAADRRSRDRFALTPFGSGVLSLFFPGLLVAAVSHQVVLMAVAVGAGALVTFDAVAGRYLLARVAVELLVPRTATAGEPFPALVRLRSDRPIEIGLEVPRASARVPALAPGRGELPLSAPRRGVLDRVLVRLHTAAPLGLVTVLGSRAVGLDRAIHIGPRPAGITIDLPTAGAGQRSPGLDVPIGLRDYVSGDSPRDVHWPAVARTGSLQVRNRRATAGPIEVTAVVILDDDGDEGGTGATSGRARAALDRLLASGAQVRLVTAEPTTPPAGGRLGGGSGGLVGAGGGGPDAAGLTWVAEAATTRDEIIIRLARAAVGRPATSPPGGGARTLMIDPEGERWSSGS